MKKTRNTTTITCAAAVTTPLPPAHTIPQKGTAVGAAAVAGGAVVLPVCATASISAAAFFTSATGLAGVRAAFFTELAIALAATGTCSQRRSTSSRQDHAAAPSNPTARSTTSVAAIAR